MNPRFGSTLLGLLFALSVTARPLKPEAPPVNSPPVLLGKFEGLRLAGGFEDSATLTRRLYGESSARVLSDGTAPGRLVPFWPDADRFDSIAFKPPPTVDPGLVLLRRSPKWDLFRVAPGGILGEDAGWLLRSRPARGPPHERWIPQVSGFPQDAVQTLANREGWYVASLPPPKDQAGVSVAEARFLIYQDRQPGGATPPESKALRIPSAAGDPAPSLVAVEDLYPSVWVQRGRRPALRQLGRPGAPDRLLRLSDAIEDGTRTTFAFRSGTDWSAVVHPMAVRDPEPGESAGRTRVWWRLGMGEPRTHEFGPGERVYDFAAAGERFAVSLVGPGTATDPAGASRVELFSRVDGELVHRWPTVEPRRIEFLTPTLLVQEVPEGIAVYEAIWSDFRAWSREREEARKRRKAEAAQREAEARASGRDPRSRESRRGQRRTPRSSGWAAPLLYLFLAFSGLAFWSPGRRRSQPRSGAPEEPTGITVTPSRPGVAVSGEPAAEGEVVILPAPDPETPRDLSPAATENLLTFLLLRAAAGCRDRGALTSADLERLLAATRPRVLARWEAVFPGQKPALAAWVADRIHRLGDELPADIRESMRARLPRPPAVPRLPRGGIAQLWKLHHLFIEIDEELARAAAAAAEPGKRAAESEALRVRVFDQALEVVHDLRRGRDLPPDLASQAETRLAEIFGELAANDEGLLAAAPEICGAAAGDAREFLTLPEVICRVCGAPLGEASQVRCDGCETPHHRDCWEFNHGCAVFACGSSEAKSLAS